MSKPKFSFSRGLFNAIFTLVMLIVVPDLIITLLQQYAPTLDLGSLRTIGISAIGVFLTVMAFCRGAWPKNSTIWALAGIGSSLFAAAYLYFLLGTPATYQVGPNVSATIDISLLALIMAIVMALNSLSNIIVLVEARRKVAESQRLRTTKVAT